MLFVKTNISRQDGELPILCRGTLSLYTILRFVVHSCTAPYFDLGFNCEPIFFLAENVAFFPRVGLNLRATFPIVYIYNWT